MTFRYGVSATLALMAFMLSVCAAVARRSEKEIGKAVAKLCAGLIFPVLGNQIIVASVSRNLSLLGSYIYVLGMDLVMYALVNFTEQYCKGVGNGQKRPAALYYLLLADAVQLLLNPIFGHAFTIEAVDLQGFPYYILVPFLGLTIHRIVDYAMFTAVILMFGLCVVKTVRIYKERYAVILVAMLVVGLLQTFYIFSRSPIDLSMIGYGVFGLLVFYLSLYYRPLRLLDRLLSDITSEMPDAFFIYDPMGRCIWANSPGLKLLGGTDRGSLENVDERLEKKLGAIRRDKENWTENRVIGTGDDASYYTLEKRMVNDQNKHLAGSYLIVRDETEEKRSIQRKLFESTHDRLTGLYTKQHLYDCIRETLGERADTDYMILFLNIKNFKVINDIFSTAFGDLVLCRIADMIRNGTTARCVFGRLNGDNFGILMPKEEFRPEELEKALAGFTVSDGEVKTQILIQMGVYVLAERDLEVSVMFDRARLALTTIRNEYLSHIAYYDEELREKILWDQQIAAMLDEAIDQMQIRPFLQPISDSSGRVVGAEALARWIHPEYGLLPPYRFIPALEKNGMIAKVDHHMWRCAASILADWKGVHDDLFLSVNISPKDFYFIDVVEAIKSLTQEYGIDPSKLRLEITETVMMTDAVNRLNILNDLHNAGFYVEMDDFGNGYSSLNLLKDMPVDILKIDMEFLAETGDKPKAKAILGNIIRLSEELHITPLTEGVETKQQFDLLTLMGCKLFQGYYFAKPMPREEFERFLLETNSSAGDENRSSEG